MPKLYILFCFVLSSCICWERSICDIDNLRVNNCALRADSVCLDRAKGRKVIQKSLERYQTPFSIKTMTGHTFDSDSGAKIKVGANIL